MQQYTIKNPAKLSRVSHPKEIIYLFVTVNF